MIQLKVCTFVSACSPVYTADVSFQTMLNCIDNSGAAIVECVNVMKMKRHAKIGMPICSRHAGM
jgi:hypothetical protein